MSAESLASVYGKEDAYRRRALLEAEEPVTGENVARVLMVHDVFELYVPR